MNTESDIPQEMQGESSNGVSRNRNAEVSEPTIAETLPVVRDSKVEAANRLSSSTPNTPAHFGRYRIIKELGKGGMGSVYLADDTKLGRQVALKIPRFDGNSPPEVVARFYREARAAARLHHPNLCPVHDVGECDGVPFLTMAYVKGQPLSQILAARKKISARSAAKLVRTLALALQEAHANSMVHPDLNPENVMLDDHQRPIVMDFGLARLHDSANDRVTKTGMIIGTPAYMAPEQVRGESDSIGPATDVYALGVILYELLTGSPPFQGATMSVLTRILTDSPPPPVTVRPGLAPVLNDICCKAISKDPADRFASMSEFADSLGKFLQKNTSPHLPKIAQRPAAAASHTNPFKTNSDSGVSVAAFAKSGSAHDSPSGRNRSVWYLYGGSAAILAVGLAILGFMVRGKGEDEGGDQRPSMNHPQTDEERKSTAQTPGFEARGADSLQIAEVKVTDALKSIPLNAESGFRDIPEYLLDAAFVEKRPRNASLTIPARDLEFIVRKPGLVTFIASWAYEGGNSPEWFPTRATRDSLKKDGWVEVGSLTRVYPHTSARTFYVFCKRCRAREKARFHHNKYGAPMIVVLQTRHLRLLLEELARQGKTL